MTKEQEAIEYLKESVLIYKNTIPKISESIGTVLSMLKEKDELYHKALGDLVKADRENIRLKKQIDLMADELVEAHKWFYSEFDNFNKEDFIKYFANKVNSNLEN